MLCRTGIFWQQMGANLKLFRKHLISLTKLDGGYKLFWNFQLKNEVFQTYFDT